MRIALRHKFLLAFELAILAAAVVVRLVWPDVVWPIAALAMAVMAIGWVGYLIATWWIHQSLSRIRKAAEAVGRGDLSRRVELHPRDEIEKLVRSFNQMADRLEQTVTEERVLQAQLTRSEKLAAIGELAATVAHEVNNPLDGLQSCSRIIRRSMDEDAGRVREMLDLMDTGLYRLEMTVRRLLTLARDETVNLAPGEMTQIVNEAVEYVEARIGRQAVTLVKEMPDAPIYVDCDQQQLVQVLINLLGNALDSMLDAGTLTVQLTHDQDNGHVRLTVHDTGSGISPEHLSNIFDPFFTTKAGGAGTGLGLAVVKKVIKAHNGRVRVDSELGQGTSFTIDLPVGSMAHAMTSSQPARV